MKEFIVDTHALIWFVEGDRRCSKVVENLIRTPGATRLVSAASIWEMAIKSGMGRLDLPEEHLELLADEGFSFLDVTAEHAWANRLLPRQRDHKDPFDRMIAAQAISEGLPLISADEGFDAYGVQRIW